MRTIQKKVSGKVKDKRKREYIESKRRVKYVIEESDWNMHENIGRNLSEMY